LPAPRQTFGRFGASALAAMLELGGKSKNTSWAGVQMFMQNQVPRADLRPEDRGAEF